MKCWTSYEKYRHLTLRDASQLEPLRKQKSFDQFLEFTHSPDKYVVAVNSKSQLANGSILIWATCTKDGCASSIAKYGIYDVLSLEDIVDNLLHWGSLPFIELINQREKWCYELFNGLQTKYTNNR